MLLQYQTQLQNLLQSPGAPVNLYSTANLNIWINTARGQLAGESECIRLFTSQVTSIGNVQYNFPGFDYAGNTAFTGVVGILNIRRLQYRVASGQKWINGKSWEWFDQYRLNNPVPASGPPIEWAQYAQGGAFNEFTGSVKFGQFFIYPVPDAQYVLTADAVGLPQLLANDMDTEAIPPLWTDAVPYFAAYLALMSAQTGQRMQEAQQMKQLYSEFVQRARQYSTPAVNRFLFEQTADPASQAALTAGPGGGSMPPPGGG